MYTILKHHSSKVLIEDVNIHMEEGWEPVGGVSVSSNQGAILFAQAMVKSDHVAKVDSLFPKVVYGGRTFPPSVKGKDTSIPSPSMN